MKREYKNIEDIFRQSLEGYKIDPPETIWKKINLKLDIRQFFRPGFSKFNFYYSCLILLIPITVSLYIFNSGKETELISNKVYKENGLNSNHKSNIHDEKVLNISEKNVTEVKAIEDQNRLELKREFISKEIESTSHTDTNTLSAMKFIRNFDPILKLRHDSLNQINSLIPPIPKPLFTVMSKKGCAPFELKINNYTQGATEYFWTFGDGASSGEKSPLHSYLYPGTYQIQLKVTGIGGTALSVIDSIEVFDKPISKTFWVYQSNLLVGEKIVIPIQTSNATKFEWDFGDGGIVKKKQAEYIYKNTGDYSINLKLWTDNNCFDSIKIADIKVVNSESKIVFPNAFCPNPGGPSSGKYSERESYFDIFHPYVKGRLAEYKISIYSKVGGIVFESEDINIGWDGYFENRLMPEGVYPFIATGKFENGESFLKKGNVTIIYRR
jgi:PKD repeat protein